CVRSSFLSCSRLNRALPSFPTRRSSDLIYDEDALVEPIRQIRTFTKQSGLDEGAPYIHQQCLQSLYPVDGRAALVTPGTTIDFRSEEHTSELQSRENLVCRLLLEKKKKK